MTCNSACNVAISDCAAFTTGSVGLVVVPVFLTFIEFGLTGYFCYTNYVTAVFFGPEILALSAAGLARVAQVPAFGPALVRLAFGFKLCVCQDGHLAYNRTSRRPSTQTEEYNDETNSNINI